jgi:hypothetical protein
MILIQNSNPSHEKQDIKKLQGLLKIVLERENYEQAICVQQMIEREVRAGLEFNEGIEQSE